MRKILSTPLSMVILALLLSAVPVHAGIYWESEVTTKGMPGQADGAKTEKHYITPDSSRVETGKGDISITDFNTMTVYHLDPASKTYTEMKLEDMGMPAGMDPKAQAMMKNMMAQQRMQVSPANETKAIEGYPCKKYNVTMMGMKSEYWVSKEVKGYKHMMDISRKVARAYEKSPMMSQMNVMEIMEKMDGFPVLVESRVMGGQSVSTLKKVEEKDLGDDLFKVPSGYTLKPMGKQ